MTTRWIRTAIIAAAVLGGLPSLADAQYESAADGAGLVVDYPVFQPIQPPRGYLAAIGAGTRTETGRPGPEYWQQYVDYDIDVKLEPETARLAGAGIITVRNETPVRRTSLVLHLYQNVFAEGVQRNETVTLTGGVALDRLAVDGVILSELPPRAPFDRGRDDGAPGYRISGTLAEVTLPAVLEPGGVVQLEVEWSFVVSGGGGFRYGHLDNRVFNLAQWYPQVAVFDDVFGQDRSPYLGNGEFYTNFGDYAVNVTVPEGWLVVGTGMLSNAEEVLTEDALNRLAMAASVDTVVRIVSAEDRSAGRATAPAPDGWHTWRLRAENVRDFAFAAGGTYVWHATGANTGFGDGRALIQNVFDPEYDYWAQATLDAKHAIEFFSDYLMPYPYPQATAAMGPSQVGGMEYPMITFISYRSNDRGLRSTVAHELSHFWLPMIVGTKEMAYAWMDEGLTVFNTSLAMADYYGERIERPGDDRGYRMVVELEMQEPIMGHMDHAQSQFGAGVAAYSKPGMLLHTLRRIMGPDRFDEAYRDYTATWAFKHPMPWDFFSMMEGAAGTSLDWFWQPWFYGTATLDQAVDQVVPGSGSADITVSNLSSGVMPVEIHLEYADGSTETVVWPPSVWAGTRSVTRSVATSGDLRRVTVDPEGYYPDMDRSNNQWEAVDG